jgi:hypothetical protein
MFAIYAVLLSLASNMYTNGGFGSVIGGSFGAFVGAWTTLSVSSLGRMQITNARVGAKSQIIKICETAGLNVLSCIDERTTILRPDRSTFGKKLKYWSHLKITITDDGDNNLLIEGPLNFLRMNKRQLLNHNKKVNHGK